MRTSSWTSWTCVPLGVRRTVIARETCLVGRLSISDKIVTKTGVAAAAMIVPLPQISRTTRAATAEATAATIRVETSIPSFFGWS